MILHVLTKIEGAKIISTTKCAQFALCCGHQSRQIAARAVSIAAIAPTITKNPPQSSGGFKVQLYNPKKQSVQSEQHSDSFVSQTDTCTASDAGKHQSHA